MIFANFWKNVCECRLLPITTDYFPDDQKKDDANKYYRSEDNIITKPQNEITMVKDKCAYVEEFLCLRLTQNL